MFISFEGIDGSGKTTQAKLLKVNLEKLGFNVILTKEPGGTELGSYIRKILLNVEMDPVSEFLLFASDRKTHVKEVIKPFLSKGFTVISDRFHDSSVAYQGYGRGVPLDFIYYVHNFILEGIIPNITVLVDIDENLSFERIKDADRIERLGIDFLRNVRKGYLKIAKNEDRFFVIDGSKTVEELEEIILNKVLEKLK
ncbi:dTMP kinase [Caldisericum exile]|uniref:Thymidylate kinase n=1 Tax=Caldisericum exile (strain DSM 21853 / NBRC 104410 / AZM16c01) TaxID=511051 RepID=A0A7U6GEF1_CALEA|nr:dTMP kinase [Caldisericum exile]BAL80888.1 thymidylate kinase [Caldisericum exile AZM16c01]